MPGRMLQNGTMLASFLALALGLRAQAPDIRVPVRLVTAPALVLSPEGALVNGLEASNFRVYDNGTAQKFGIDTESNGLSVAIAVQANQDVRDYLSFIIRTGSVVESLLIGESGEAAVIAYADDVKVVKPFSDGSIEPALRGISWTGSRKSRSIDAGLRGITLLEQRTGARSRILVFVGQAMDSGSESKLPALREAAEKANVTVFALALPQIGKTFVSDNFALEGLSSQTDRGGFIAGLDLGHAISVLTHSSKAADGADPFSVLTAATGGLQAHVRKQREFENAIAAMGEQLRGSYWIRYYPAPAGKGYHTIKIAVDVHGAQVHARPGYWLE